LEGWKGRHFRGRPRATQPSNATEHNASIAESGKRDQS